MRIRENRQQWPLSQRQCSALLHTGKCLTDSFHPTVKIGAAMPLIAIALSFLWTVEDPEAMAMQKVSSAFAPAPSTEYEPWSASFPVCRRT